MDIALLSNDPSYYSTQALYREIVSKGHRVDIINYLDCNLEIDRHGNTIISHKEKELPRYDLAIPRIGTYALEHTLELLQHFPAKRMINNPLAIMKAKDKWQTAKILGSNHIDMPQTKLVSKVTNFNLLKQKLPFVLKKTVSSQGLGTYLIQTNQELLQRQQVIENSSALYLCQEYIKEANGKDYRFIVLGNKVIACMQRLAKPGEFRSNAHLGAICTPHSPTPVEEELAINTSKCLGLDFAGIDIIHSSRGPLILEANSSPGLEKIQEVSGVNIAEKFISYLEQACQN